MQAHLREHELYASGWLLRSQMLCWDRTPLTPWFLSVSRAACYYTIFTAFRFFAPLFGASGDA